MTTTTVLQDDHAQNDHSSKNRLNWAIVPVIALFLYWVTGALGLGICYHRLLTHRSFATPKWFEYFLTICGVTAMEGGPLLWVAIHRKHHQYADKEGDPHSPRDGKWWSHAGWVLVGNALRQDVPTL